MKKLDSESGALSHVVKVKGMLEPIIGHLRQDIARISEPKAQALFETSAEVLAGLVKAFDHYEHKSEKAWE